MTLRWRHELHGAVAVLLVVLVDERAYPLPGRHQADEWVFGIGGAVSRGLEDALVVRVIVAAFRTAKHRRDPECHQRGQHRGALHRATIIGE